MTPKNDELMPDDKSADTKDYKSLNDIPARTLATRVVSSLILAKGNLNLYAAIIEKLIEGIRADIAAQGDDEGWQPTTEKEFLVWVTGEVDREGYNGVITCTYNDRWRLGWRAEDGSIVTDDGEAFTVDGKEIENPDEPSIWISKYAPLPAPPVIGE